MIQVYSYGILAACLGPRRNLVVFVEYEIRPLLDLWLQVRGESDRISVSFGLAMIGMLQRDDFSDGFVLMIALGTSKSDFFE